MRRRLFAILSALLLLLCVAVVVLWVRSYSNGGDTFWSNNPRMGFEFRAYEGLGVVQVWAARDEGRGGTEAPEGTAEDSWQWGDFYWARLVRRARTIDVVSFPLWSPALVSLIIGSAASVVPLRARLRERRLRRSGRCPSCGYDLRATPQRCPECGREPRVAAVESEA